MATLTDWTRTDKLVAAGFSTKQAVAIVQLIEEMVAENQIATVAKRPIPPSDSGKAIQ